MYKRQGIGLTLLVVGAGGGFARVLREAGVAAALGNIASQLQLPPLIYGWLLAAFIRVATGSATVAITTAAGLLVPLLAQDVTINRELLVLSVGCGSLFLSHLNDGGFWIVKESLGLTVGQTLRTWTVVETLIGLLGLGGVLLLDVLFKLCPRPSSSTRISTSRSTPSSGIATCERRLPNCAAAKPTSRISPDEAAAQFRSQKCGAPASGCASPRNSRDWSTTPTARSLAGVRRRKRGR